jgi:tetratricopeptide (TPR) repeat protein
MRKWALTGWLFLACICVSPPSKAQSEQSDYAVSVRQLRIPPKALRAYDQGMERLAKKDAPGSLQHFHRAIAEYADYYEAYDRIGFAYLQLWRVPEAEQAFRKSIQLSGEQFAHPLLALGAILNDLKKFGEAESVTRKGLELEPDSWRGHYYLALALFGLNRLVEAEESVRETLRLKSDFPQAYLLLADIHSHEEDYLSLLSDLDEYLKLVPDSPASAKVNALREFAQARMSGFRGNTTLAKPQP